MFTQKKITLGLLWIAITSYVLYLTCGRFIITEAYQQRSIQFFNRIIEGRNSYSLSYYFNLADTLVIKILIVIVLLSFLPYLPFLLLQFRAYRRSVINKLSITKISFNRVAIASIIVFIITILPIIFTSLPPLIDYPNHLARVFILDELWDSASLQRFYEVHSLLLPNVGMDVLCLALAKIMPIETAGRIFIAFMFAVTVGGCIFLNQCIFKQFSLWPLLSSVFLYNWILLLGFLNYLLGVGILLWATGGWLWLRRQSIIIRVIYGNFASLLLFFCHLSSLGLYASIIGGYEIQQCLSSIREKRNTAIYDFIASASTFLMPTILFMLSKTSEGVKEKIWYTKPIIWSKFASIFNSLMFGIALIDISSIIICLLIVVVIFVKGKLYIPKPFYFPMIFLIIIYFLMPSQLLGSTYADSRLPIAIFMVAISVSQVKLSSKYLHTALTIVLGVFLIVRSLIFSYYWYNYDLTINGIINTFKYMKPESILFVTDGEDFPCFFKNEIKQPPIWHLASVATIRQEVFVPAIWANPTEQPITVKDRYKSMAVYQGGDPLKIYDQLGLERAIEEIRAIISDAGLSSVPIYLLMLDTNIDIPNKTSYFNIIDKGYRYKFLQIKKPHQKIDI